MIVFYYIVGLMLAIFIFRILTTKSKLKEAEQLRTQFETWANSKNDAKARPNNHTFARLYKYAYNQSEAITDVQDYKDIGRYIQVKTTPVSIIQSFPSMNPQIYPIEVATLDNLVDYFEDEYQQNFKLSFWLNFAIFLPQKFVHYIGLKEDSILSKVMNVLYWIVIGLFTLYKPLLRNFLIHFLK